MDNELADPKDKLVLIVEDDESMRDFLGMAVKREGFRTALAMSAKEALEQVAKSTPDAILLDLMLPDRGGYEVLRQLQQDGTGQVPVIVMTARRMDRKTVDMIRQEPNFAEYLEKPIKAVLLTMALHRRLKTKPPSP